jgi:hypothetical protein
MQHDHAIDRTKARGTAISRMEGGGGGLASGVDRQIVLEAHRGFQMIYFRRDEYVECVAGRKPSCRTHDQSQELLAFQNLAVQ